MFAISYYDWNGGEVNGVPAWLIVLVACCIVIGLGFGLSYVWGWITDRIWGD